MSGNLLFTLALGAGFAVGLWESRQGSHGPLRAFAILTPFLVWGYLTYGL